VLKDVATSLHETGQFEGEIDVKVFLRSALLAKDPDLLPFHETPLDTAANVDGDNDRAASSAFEPGNVDGDNDRAASSAFEPGDDKIDVVTKRGAPQQEPSRRPSNFLRDADRVRTKKENDALSRERNGSLKSITKDGWRILATCAVAAAAQGMAQESIVGANLKWPVELGLATFEHDTNRLLWKENGLVTFSLVNAIAYLTASIIGAWISDPLTYIFGRRAALLFAGVCTFSAPIGAGYCQGPYGLLGCRLIQGVGIGSKSSVIPIIIAESFTKDLRTRLLVCWQAFVGVPNTQAPGLAIEQRFTSRTDLFHR
jgi:hypothetical protein